MTQDFQRTLSPRPSWRLTFREHPHLDCPNAWILRAPSPRPSWRCWVFTKVGDEILVTILTIFKRPYTVWSLHFLDKSFQPSKCPNWKNLVKYKVEDFLISFPTPPSLPSSDVGIKRYVNFTRTESFRDSIAAGVFFHPINKTRCPLCLLESSKRS